MKTKEELIDWLRDAYAMEKAMELALEKLVKSNKAPVTLSERASIHLAETQGHAEAVAACLKELGTDTSALKTTLAQGMEFMKAASTMFAKDEAVKDLLAAYASEHFEIACYTALATAAEEAGIEPIVSTSAVILAEEKHMATWLHENLPTLVRGYLAQSDGAEGRRGLADCNVAPELETAAANTAPPSRATVRFMPSRGRGTTAG